jgi:hypothetical protein
VKLFNAILSETNSEEKRALLLLQRCVRKSGKYVYLEIGSHLGGTIQPHYVDPECKLIYSVDKRPLVQPDGRGWDYKYSENSTTRMLENLHKAFPSITKQLVTFDVDASNVNPSLIKEKPVLCFIDGQHTDKAVISDFEFCLAVCQPNAIIAFHDAWIVVRGIQRIKKALIDSSIRFEPIMLGGSIYAILLNEAVDEFADELKLYSQNEAEYFSRAKKLLFMTRVKNIAKRLLNSTRLTAFMLQSAKKVLSMRNIKTY